MRYVNFSLARSIATIITLIMGVALSQAHAAGNIKEILGDIANRCTKIHGYDWANPGEVGDYELGRGEKSWRSCVYEGIRHQIVPTSKVPEQYERAIARDIEFTRLIEAGEMTRFERWQKNRMNTELLSANEDLANPDSLAMQKRLQQEHLEKFINSQMQDLLRVQPPVPRLRP